MEVLWWNIPLILDSLTDWTQVRSPVVPYGWQEICLGEIRGAWRSRWGSRGRKSSPVGIIYLPMIRVQLSRMHAGF